mmetsp:Transcript_8542/g.15496  ORF Transcript_8542/g.15496 Transcript_8542/m.15496 type:complete len:249 (-) Transcript_8542:2196-2942(-)
MTENGTTANRMAGVSSSEYGPSVHVTNHPVLSHKISILRSSATQPAEFRSVLREITFHLGYEATASLTTRPIKLSVPVGHDHVECMGNTIVERTALIPILRSGLGMVDPMLELVPNSGVHHIGMYKTHNVPVQYYQRLPRKCEADVAYILDPVMATSKTVMSVVGILKKWGVGKIVVVSVLASKAGIETMTEAHPDVTIIVGTVDHEVKEDGTVLPGLGDAGDRLFGTPMIDNDNEELLHPSKRKKSY